MYKEVDQNPDHLSLRGYTAATLDIDQNLKRDFDTWLSGQYALNMAALDDLGFAEPDGIPALEEIRDAVQPATQIWLADRVRQGNEDQLIIAPSVQAIGLQGDKYAPGLLPRYDKKQGLMAKTKIAKSWRSFGDKDPLHDNGDSAPFSASILLDNRASAPNPATITSGQEIPEQTYRYQASLDRKIAVFEEEKAVQAKAGRQLAAIALPQLVVLTARQRQMDQSATTPSIIGTTSLVHYPTFKKNGRDADSIECQPTFYLMGRKADRIVLDSRWVTVAGETLRRVLRLPLDANDQM